MSHGKPPISYHGAPRRPPRAPFQRILPSKRIEAALSQPSWSVRSLLPENDATPFLDRSRNESSTAPASQEITREKLHHLLNLSALPLPKTLAEEQSLLKTLRDQIHFVREIQKVDTTNVEPLRAISDETAAHIEESTVTLEDLREALDQEEVVGRNGRIRKKVRRDTNGDEIPVVDETSEKAQRWKPFEMGQVLMEGEVPPNEHPSGELPAMRRGEVPGRRVGRYFVVRKGAKDDEKAKATVDQGSE